MTKQQFLLGETAKLLRVKPYKIVYALTTGLIEDVAFRLGGKRVFQPDDVRRLADHFGVGESAGNDCLPFESTGRDHD
jgi:hypothetical protein